MGKSKLSLISLGNSFHIFILFSIFPGEPFAKLIKSSIFNFLQIFNIDESEFFL